MIFNQFLCAFQQYLDSQIFHETAALLLPCEVTEPLLLRLGALAFTLFLPEAASGKDCLYTHSHILSPTWDLWKCCLVLHNIPPLGMGSWTVTWGITNIPCHSLPPHCFLCMYEFLVYDSLLTPICIYMCTELILFSSNLEVYVLGYASVVNLDVNMHIRCEEFLA